MSELHFEVDDAPGARRTLVLAHGAGQGMDSPFMAAVARGLSSRGVRVVRFEFAYMRAARASGKRRPPDRAPALLACWREVIGALAPTPQARAELFIGGKSMGGRMASLVADEAGVGGLVCLGYPFHPPGKPDATRTAHLETLKTPALICQGERDPFGKRAEVEGYALAPSIALVWLEDGDHGLRPRKRSGRTEQANLDEAVQAVARFCATASSR